MESFSLRIRKRVEYILTENKNKLLNLKFNKDKFIKILQWP